MRVLFLQCPSDKRLKLVDGSRMNLLPRAVCHGKNPAYADAFAGSKGKAAQRVGHIINVSKTPNVCKGASP
jgi:hypothetical protein